MKKLKVPQLIENSELPKKMSQKEFEEMLVYNWIELIPEFTFDVEGLNLHTDLDGEDNSNFLYAYISCEGAADYYDYAIVKTDDIYFSTYAKYKKAVKTLAKQLTRRWKEWVSALYEVKE